MEITYNDGKQFPLSLRELLYLAGQSCDVLDYGLSNLQKEMQEDVREWLTVYKFTMQRPFFVIDVYGGSDTFAFVYLDEEVNDPKVVVANLDNSPNSWLTTSQFTLSDFVGNRINRLKNGINPHLIFISSNSKRNSA